MVLPIIDKRIFILLLFILYIALTIRNNFKTIEKLPIPVLQASSRNWDPNSYWSYSTYNNKVHKGIDIFSDHKTPIISSYYGFVLRSGNSINGGNFIYAIDSELRVYYYAHLNQPGVKSFKFIKPYEKIGLVGNTGNAITKPYHLHFSVFSIFPMFKNINLKEHSWWDKMFYIDPNLIFGTK